MDFQYAYKDLKEMQEEIVKKYGEKTYLFFLDKQFTFSQLNKIVNKTAHSLLNEGVKRQDKVCVHLTNCPEFIFVFLACFKIGAVCVPINPALKPDEIEYLINNSDSKVVISQKEILPNVLGIIKNCPNVLKVVCTGNEKADGFVLFDDFIAQSADTSPEVKVSGDDLAGIIYTSGTTGKPKGVMLSHKNYIADTKMVAEWVAMTDNDKYMCVLPLFHVNGQVVTTLSTFMSGASLVLAPKFSASTFFEDAKKHQITAFSAVPTIYAMLLNHPDAHGEDLSSLRFCICGAAPMPVELFKNFEAKFNAKILEGYGLSEGTCASTVNPIDGTRKIGSIGLPLKGQTVKIFDNNDKELPPNQTGEIVIKGPNVMQGYYKNEQASAETLKNSWLHSGDLGCLDDEGYVYITGRKKEMIIRGGENIYPKEIEEVLYRYDKILEAAVVGIPDKIYGEEVFAFIHPKEKQTITEEEIIEYTKQHLANYKCPKKIVVTNKPLPKTATGKIQKHVIRDEWVKNS